MRNTILTCAIPLGVLAAAGPSALLAQAAPAPDTTTSAPYSTLRLRVSAARNVNHEPLHDFWRAGTGGSVGVTTPFHVGSVGLAATLIPFRRRDDAGPDFRALLIGVDWGVEIPATGPLHARAAARVGDFVMLIENPDVWLDSESELFVGGDLSAGLPLGKRVTVTASGSLGRVYTRPSLDLVFLTIGLEYATRTPRWLRSVLE